MSEPINLNKLRKAKIRAGAKLQAAENRVSFGRSKAEKSLTRAEAEKRERELQAHRREP